MSLLQIDDREKDEELIEALICAVETAGHEYEITRLVVGDLVWDNQIGIEHKSTKDFVASVKSGLLDDQLMALKQYPHHFLFIDGMWSRAVSHGKARPFTMAQKDAKVLSIMAKMHVPVFQVPDQNRMIQGILDVRRFIQDDGERAEFLQRYSHAKNRQNATLDSYLKLPYCGPKRVDKLVDAYPSYYEFLVAYRALSPDERKKEFRYLDKRTRKYLDSL